MDIVVLHFFSLFVFFSVVLTVIATLEFLVKSGVISLGSQVSRTQDTYWAVTAVALVGHFLATLTLPHANQFLTVLLCSVCYATSLYVLIASAVKMQR